MTADIPMVSVILPTYNRMGTLRHAIDSVLGQTFGDFELIVVDDGSTEDVRGLVASIADPRVRYLRLDVRSGPAKARNAGIRIARADLLAFQDSDDEWLPEKLDRQVALMRSSPPDVGLVVGAFLLKEPHRTREVRSRALERGEHYGLDIVQGVPLVTPVWLVRRHTLERAGGFDESLASAEDYDLAFKLSRICAFRAVAERIVVKIGHADSLSGDVTLLARGLETVYRRHSGFWRPYPSEEKRMLALIAMLHLRRGSRRDAVRTMIRSLIRHPLQPRTLSRLTKTLLEVLGRRVAAPWRQIVDARRDRLHGPRVMEAFGQFFPRATFVQIGSNDGDKHDPLRRVLRRRQWSGVMVEPVPYVFARLRRNYGSMHGIALENVAVTATGDATTLPFYYVAQADPAEALPDWYDELGSFRKEIVLSHADRVPGLEQRLVTTQVSCVSLEELCRRNRLDTVDLIHMDTEGYDGQLVAAIDFTRRRPVLLIYEHKHLGAEERARCQALLRMHGYDLFEEGADTWCADLRAARSEHRRFLRAWHRIKAQSDSIHS